ncbi:MAG: cysteine hydrolase [Streptococcaceae bacterium]|nr:cysteine hydrolase [Streptococcaceae bacterium]
MKQGLLIIDVQRDYFSGGKKPLERPEEALAVIKLLEEKFKKENLPIVYVQHIKPDRNADFFALGSEGAELHPELSVEDSSIIIEKQFPNSFFQTNLLEKLKEIQVEQLIITGMMTHMCVDSTTRTAKELGFQPIVIADSTATCELSLGNEKVAAEQVQISFLSALQNFSEVMNSQEFL